MGFLEVPEYGRQIESIEDFFKCANSIAHFAVKRAIGYFHHFIVTAWEDTKKQLWEYYVCFSNMITGQGKVNKRGFSRNEILGDIKKGNMYVIEAPNYPKTEYDKKEAHARFWKRYGEKAYALAYNNCEHLVQYILTGNPYSEQIEKAGKWLMFCVDSFDNFISHGKRNALKLAGCLLATIPVSFFVKAAVTTVVNEMQTAIVWYTSSVGGHVPVDCATKTIAKCASKQLGCDPCKILKHKKCATVAKNASREALKKTAVTTFVVTGLIEGAFAAYEIKKMGRDLEKNYITKHDFKREVTKRVSGATGATFGSVGARLIGQAVCPIPVLGFFVGSALGNIGGRWLASTASGQIFDDVVGK